VKILGLFKNLCPKKLGKDLKIFRFLLLSQVRKKRAGLMCFHEKGYKFFVSDSKLF